MAALNDGYFANDDYRRIAGGASFPKLALRNDGSGHAEWTDWAPGEGGLISTRSHLIPPGTRLVRFAGLREGRTAPLYFGQGAASGVWWMEWGAYKAIERYADKIEESVTYAVRQVCAVPAEWSDLSYVVQGTTRSPLMAWAGMGRSVMSGQGIIDPLDRGKPKIEQYYIPGLSDPDLNKKAIFISHHGPLDPGMSREGARRAQEEQAAHMERMRQSIRKP